MTRLAGKVALVSGAGSGIGRAIVERFSAEGAIAYGGDVDVEAAQAVVSTPELALHLDVTDPASWSDAVRRLQRSETGLDILVNCAGVDGTNDNIRDCSDDEWRRVMAVNLDGTFLGMQAAVELMRRRRRGAIINISSVLAVVADGEAVSYTSSKGAVRGLTKSVALEVAPDGIRCNSIHPGYITTPMTDRWLEDLRAEGMDGAGLAALHPVGRLGHPGEVAALAVYLASAEASFVTGAECVVDGGYLAI